MDDPKPVEIQYPGSPPKKELGIAIDDETVEGGYMATALEPGDIIKIDGELRRVVGIEALFATERPGIEGADVTTRIRHEPPDARRPPPGEPEGTDPQNKPRGHWVSDS